MRGAIPAELEVVEASVDRYPVDPGIETGVALETLEGLPRLHERVLSQVMGVLMMGGHVVTKPVDPLLELMNQLVVGREITCLSPTNTMPHLGRLFGIWGSSGQ
jgi:hypothetical protein